MNRKLNVLIACEESQAVCSAFRKLGHNAFSCDLQECSGGHPEWHIQGDCLSLLGGNCIFRTMDRKLHYQDGKWDLLIAHPPCTYMSNAGACRMYPTKGVIDTERLKKAMDAKAFFMEFMEADCDHIAIENPRPLKIVELPKETQHIQPYMFGEPYSKMTFLWLQNLPELIPTDVVSKYKPYLPSGTSRNAGTDYNKGTAHGSRKRSKTFPGIAQAMAEQWSEFILNDDELEEQMQIF